MILELVYENLRDLGGWLKLFLSHPTVTYTYGHRMM